MNCFGTVDAYPLLRRLGGDAGCSMDPVSGDGTGSMQSFIQPDSHQTNLLRSDAWFPLRLSWRLAGFLRLCVGKRN